MTAAATLQDALPAWALEQNLVLQAGAGTGKTHSLVTLMLHVLSGANARRVPVPPAKLVALTFTEKAASEMRERLQRRLAPLADGAPVADREPELARTFELLQLPIPKQAFWQRLRRDVSLATIGTFHSFCGGLLRRHAAAAGLDPEFEVLDEGDARELFRDAVDGHVLQALASGDAGVRALVDEFGLNAAGQQKALLELVREILGRLDEDGRAPRELDDGRFSDDRAASSFVDAAASLRAAVEGLSALAPKHLAKFAGTQGTMRALLDALTIDDAARSLAALEEAAKQERKPPGESGLPVEQLREAVGELRAAVAGVRGAPLGRAFIALLEGVESRFRDAKEARSALDFSDLQRRVRDLLLTDLATRHEVKRRIDALLVDEFQDTSRLQLDLVALLAEVRSGEQAPDNGSIAATVRFEPGVLCVVGDRKQSIYEFRGADVAVFTTLEQALTGAPDRPARVEHLRRSYRSRPPLVRFVNDLFRRAMPAATQPFQVMFGPEDALETTRPDHDGALVELLVAQGDDAEEQRTDEARRIADRVHALLNDPDDPVRVVERDRATGAEIPRRPEGRDVALLFRRFTHLDLYRRALASRGIAHVVVGGRGFFEALEVIDAWALVRAIDDANDTLASASLLRSPWCSLTDPTLAQLALAHGSLALSRLLADRPVLADPSENERFSRLLGFVREMRAELDRLGPARVLSLALDRLDYLAVAATQPGRDAIAANVEKVLDVLRDAEQRTSTARGAIRRFSEQIRSGAREADAAASEESDARAVRLMTIHQSKGLEFAVAVLVDCGAEAPGEADRIAYERDLGLAVNVRLADEKPAATRALTLVRERLTERAAAESLRLFYVAVTRARDALILSGIPNDGSWLALAAGLGAHLRDPPATTTAATPAIAPEPAPPAPPPPAPARLPLRELTATVTRLQDFELCPERYRLRHEIGLSEHPPAIVDPDDEIDDSPLDAFARGTLAHRLLELADFAEPDAGALDALVRAEGHAPDRPEIREVRDDVLAFLASPFAARLRAIPPSRRLRELPFLLRLELGGGRTLGIKGQVDLVALSVEGADLVDYKHARSRAGARERYAFQLASYAVAVGELLGGAPLPVRAALVFLRDRQGEVTPEELTPEAREAHVARLRVIGQALLEAYATGRWARRDRETCDRLACGYRRRCFPREQTIPLAAPPEP